LIHIDANRALEIFNSLGVIEVLHRGSPVWIEQVNNNSAEIQYLSTQQRAHVPVEELIETG
jgi:small acid-soluble spore protein H (minor)